VLTSKRLKNIAPSDEKYDILFAGRLIKEKNVDVLLKAVDQVRKSMPSVRCHIIGGDLKKGGLTGCCTIAASEKCQFQWFSGLS